MQGDIVLVFRVYLLSLLWQVGFWPVLKKIFPKSPDEGWSVTRIAFSLLTAIIVWQLSLLGIPLNTGLVINIVGIILIVFSVWKFGLKLPDKEVRKNILISEYLFFVGLLGISIVRGFVPNIDSLEKFMDYGFIARYLLSPTLPAMDMWQAGSQINYYSFGHFLVSVWTRLWRVDLAHGYNLALGFLAGSGLSISYGVIRKVLGDSVSERVGSLAGLLGSLMVVIGGNGHSLWYFLKNRGFESYWYADATRFIHNTIHEFPSYSFVVSDLHGHLIDLPVVLFFLYIIVDWFRKSERILEILMGVLFGVMMMTNTWDVAVYGMLLGIVGLTKVLTAGRDLVGLVRSALVVIATMAGTSILWWWSFVSISDGVALVKMRSPLWQLGVLWGLGLIICGIASWWSRNSKNKGLVWSLCLCVLFLILIPEFVYAKDIYPDHPRANTMFKLTYQASIMIGIIFGVAVGVAWKKILVLIPLLVLFLGSMMFPVQAFPSFYSNFKIYQGLDGEKWIKNESEEKWEMIVFLRSKNAEGKNMVEAVGDSYTKLNMISVFSGIPTVQGWRVHEWLWRGGYDGVAKREAEVRSLYEGKDKEEVEKIIKDYKIKWVVVGEDERKAYSVNHEKIKSLGEVVWTREDAYIVEVR